MGGSADQGGVITEHVPLISKLHVKCWSGCRLFLQSLYVAKFNFAFCSCSPPFSPISNAHDPCPLFTTIESTWHNSSNVPIEHKKCPLDSRPFAHKTRPSERHSHDALPTSLTQNQRNRHGSLPAENEGAPAPPPPHAYGQPPRNNCQGGRLGRVAHALQTNPSFARK